MISYKVLTGGLLGWSLGTNDAANIFGTAVSSNMVKWRTAATLIAVFVIIGAFCGGSKGLETYSKLSGQTVNSAAVISLSAALTVTFMTIFKLPVSTSQAVVGTIVGASLARNGNFEWERLIKVFTCWVGAPIGACILAIILYSLFSFFFKKLNMHFLTYDVLMRTLLIASGIYGAYALGANSAANVTGVFYKSGAFGNDPQTAKFSALLFGGVAIALGAVTFSKNVMYTVGKSIVKLNAFSAFIAVLCEATTIHIYSLIGVPVSTSQAVVGAVFGIGILKGVKTVSFKTLFKIVIGWVLTPVIGSAICYGLIKII